MAQPPRKNGPYAYEWRYINSVLLLLIFVVILIVIRWHCRSVSTPIWQSMPVYVASPRLCLALWTTRWSTRSRTLLKSAPLPVMNVQGLPSVLIKFTGTSNIIHTTQAYEPEEPGHCSPLTRTKPLFLGRTLNFSGRSQQQKMKKIYFILIKRKNGTYSVQRDELPKICKYWLG